MKNKRVFPPRLLFMLSVVLLTVIQTPINWAFWAWVAMVPFVIACSPKVQTGRVFLWSYVAGFLYWLASLYWIVPITVAGWILLGLYMGLLWPLLAVAIRWCRRENIPLFLAVPVLVVGAERLQGFPLGGFYWRLLGHSQYANITLIQISDVFGVAGVSFLVAMANGFLADMVVRFQIADCRLREGEPHRGRLGRTVVLGAVATLVAVSSTVLYGRWRIQQATTAVTEGPLIASLQSNVPQSVKETLGKSAEMFDDLMSKSREAAAAGADLIVWPETMVQGILQPDLWPLLEPAPEQDKMFHEALCRHAKDTAYLLVGGYGADILARPDGTRYLGNYNSAFLYRPDGTKDPRRYDKIHLVLFGEYIPFRETFPWLFEQLHKFMPEGYSPDYSLEHGKQYTVFDMTTPTRAAAVGEPNVASPGNGRTPARHRFAVIICYEDTVPYVARNFVLDQDGNKRIDWLVNISNDGWFVRYLRKAPHFRPSAELPQHAAICTFRAVENRVAVIRSVNTGISCLIDSSGRIHNGYIKASDGFPSQAMDRTGIAGWFLDRMPIDKRTTFYSRHGQWLDTTCAAVFVALLAARCAAAWLARRNAKHTAANER